MNLRDLLDTDVVSVPDRLRRFWPWWTDQLAEIFAPLFAPRAGRLLTAQRSARGDYDLQRGERPVGIHRPDKKSAPVVLVLPQDRCLTRSVSLPKLPRRDLRRLVTLDLDRLTPFAAPEVWFGLSAAGGRTENGVNVTGFASARSLDVEEALKQAHAAQLSVCELAATSPAGLILLKPGSGVRDGRLTQLGTKGWVWGLLAVLVAANVTLAVCKDISRTQTLELRAESERPRALQLEEEKQQLQALRDLEATRVAERDQHEPLRLLAAVARALPANSVVRTFSFDGATLRLTGRKPSGVDLAVALRSERSLQRAANTDPSALPSDETFDISTAVAGVPQLRQRFR